MGTIKLLICVAAAAATTTPARSAADSQPYAIAVRMLIGGEGGWDYPTFDSTGKRLFLSRGSHVQVVDTRRDTLVGDIPNTPGVHGVALVPSVGHGFTSNGRDSSVTVFDLRTLATLARIKLPAANPDAIIYDPFSKHVFTFNAGSSSVSAIDPATNQVLGTLSLGGQPEFAVADGRGRMYVNLEDSSAVACFDTKKFELLSHWPLAPGEEPTGIAMDLVNHRLFSACANKKMIVLDTETGKFVAELPIGERVDGLAFDPVLRMVLSTNGEGTLSVIHEDSADQYTKLADVPTQRGARTVTLDVATHRVYTVTAQYGEAPPATAEQPHPRPRPIPGSFVILALDPTKPATPRSH